MVALIVHSGGDIIKFAGDAIIAVYPSSDQLSIKDATLRASQVALELNKQVFLSQVLHRGVFHFSFSGVRFRRSSINSLFGYE